ncbi:Methanogenesis regulatory histidine kinase FilI [ANME-1 cluster archaeon GoMg2]|nr:Methanogenesis regulatory histidine kinase FilI [ANME-1 cluster archaeon GoMg2]
MVEEIKEGAPCRILVCDDDPAFRKLVRTYLLSGANGTYVLREAGREEEIQDALDNGRIDLILMDILMPEKSGTEWLMEIVAKQIAPVIMLTGYGNEELAVQSLHEGAIDYIPKDHLTKDRLRGTIKAALETWKRMQTEEERDRMYKELEVKNKELERFTYTVSHDLNSPLLTIQGFISILREDIEQNERENIERDMMYIEKAATKMEKLLNNTLQLSRIGRVANPPEDVPFGEIVQEAQEQTFEQIRSSGVEIAVAEALPTVHVDRMRIAEVLVNLITNSINYMGEQPHPKIEIGYRRDGEETVFFVRDNGIGIEKSQHEKVFDLFYTVDGSSEGTGAGLAIVKRIIEVHRDRIWIESEKGKGCTVCFTLPVSSD